MSLEFLLKKASENPNYRRKFFKKIAAWAGSKGFGSLSGPMYPRQGQGHKAMMVGEELHGWDKYIALVAHAYKKSPERTSAGENSFNALTMHIVKNFQRIISKVDVEFVDYDPYSSAEEMAEEVKTKGVLRVSTLYNQSEAFTPEVNLKLRAVHDYLAHLQANPSRFAPKQFTFAGEVKSYNKHLQLIGPKSKAAAALFVEIIGQTCHEIHFGHFPDQKVITLPQFDYVKLGNVDGYSVIDGDLIKR